MRFSNITIIIFFFLSGSIGYSQSSISWFDPSSQLTYDETIGSVDCDITYEGYDNSLGVTITDFEPKPFFMHTQPQVQKWMKDKYLLECTANIYRAHETTFLLLHMSINSENAKHAYGNLEKGSSLKITFDDDEHIYVDNIERDRGKAQRSKSITLYEGIYPLEGFEIKELGRKNVVNIGIVWEEGYQEYEVQNSDLIRNQVNCLKNK